MESTSTIPSSFQKPVSDKPKALQVLATIVSYVFHPIFMPTIMALALYFFSPVSFKGYDNTALKYRLISIVMITVFFPLLSILLMKALGFIKSIHMRDPKDRIIPLISTMIFYFWVQQVFSNPFKLSGHEFLTPFILRVLLLGCFWGIIVLFMVNIFFKASMHTTAAGGMVGIILVLLFTSPVNLMTPLFVALIIAGLIGSARLILNEHRPGEIWLGYFLGISVQLAAWLYLS